MNTPEQSARRILLGAGLGLSLASGIALLDGRIQKGGIINWIIPSAAIITILLWAWTEISISKGKKTPFRKWFGTLNDNNAKDTMIDEISDVDVGAAWARLEEAMRVEDMASIEKHSESE